MRCPATSAISCHPTRSTSFSQSAGFARRSSVWPRTASSWPRVCYLGPAGFGAEIADQVDSAKVLAQLASGSTVVLQGLHRLWPPLIDFVRRAVDDIGHPVQANAYITPTNNRGFDFHYDVHDVFVLQVPAANDGSCTSRCTSIPCRRNRGRPTAVASPTGRRRAGHRHRSRGGDALYLPRGWVHAAGHWTRPRST